MSDNKNNLQAIGLLLILSLIWGTSFILIKQGLKVFAADEVAALRVTAACLFLLPVALIKLKELSKKDYSVLFISGLMGIFIPAFLFAYAQTRLASSVAGILNTLSPLWTMILGALFFGQRFKGYAIIGIIIGFGGSVILALSRSGGTLGGFNEFTLLIVLACAFYGANVNWVKFKIHNIAPFTITCVSVLLIGPFAAIYLFGFSNFTTKLDTIEGAWRACGFVVLLGCMSTSIATALFNKLIKIIRSYPPNLRVYNSYKN